MLLLFLLSQSLQAQAQIIDRVYARVGDDIITKFDVESLDPDRIKAIYSIKDKAEHERVLGEFTKNGLVYLVDQYVVLNAAKREGVGITDEEVDAAIKDVVETNNITISQLESLLKEENKTFAQYKWQLKMDILSTRVRSRLLAPKVVVTEAEISEYLKKNQDTLDLSDQYELRMLSLDSRQAIEKALEYFKKNRSFLDTVAKFGADEDGGYLGWFEINSLDPSFSELIKGKKVGEVSDVQVSGGAYRVFYIEDFKNKFEGSSEARQIATSKISEEKTRNIYDKWLKDSKQRILVQYMY